MQRSQHDVKCCKEYQTNKKIKKHPNAAVQIHPFLALCFVHPDRNPQYTSIPRLRPARNAFVAAAPNSRFGYHSPPPFALFMLRVGCRLFKPWTRPWPRSSAWRTPSACTWPAKSRPRRSHHRPRRPWTPSWRRTSCRRPSP